MRGLLSIAAVAGLLVPVTQAATKPPAAGHTHTAAGMATAHRLLLTSRDFPKSWTSTPAGKAVPALTCGSFAPSTTGVVEIGAAASPNFRAGATGPFASEAVYVYATARQARTFWRRAVGPGIAGCFSQSVTQGSTQAVRFAVKKTELLPLPRLGDRSAAYRLRATATTTGQSVTAYFDLLLIGRGAAVAAITFSGFSEPVSSELELAGARAAARRLAAT
jgi:hypothetical protein